MILPVVPDGECVCNQKVPPLGIEVPMKSKSAEPFVVVAPIEDVFQETVLVGGKVVPLKVHWK
jgi:hypothetical protein